MSSAGNFRIEVWKGGYPVWCEIRYGDDCIAKIHHGELGDLRYAVEKAMQQARLALGENYKNEV